MKKILTISAVLFCTLGFSQTQYWEETEATGSIRPAEATASLFADNSGGTASYSLAPQTQTTTTESNAPASFAGIVQAYQAYQPVNTQSANVTAPHVIVWGTSPFQDSMWAFDTTSGWTVVSRISPSLPGFTITGMTGLTMDPTTGDVYIIMKVSAVSGRVLGKINLATGVCTQVGNLGDNFSSITFGSDGQLYGATGNGATVPETLYKIDKNTGTKTLLYAMGNGVDGEILAYNHYDNFIYHWSGNGTVVMEKMASSAVTYTPTNIPITGTTGGETFGALCITDTKILISNISSAFKYTTTSGVYSAGNLSSNPDDIRGLVIRPDFAINTNTICVNDTIKLASVGTNIYKLDSYLSWGDGDVDTIAAVPNSSAAGNHIYTTAGTYTVNVILRNDDVPANLPDTLEQFVVTVNALPVVAVTGDAVLCPAEVSTLTSSNGSAYQWYMDGTVMAGETNASISASTAGVYNVFVTDANGCSDSAAVGTTVISVPNPVVNLGNDSTVCGGILLDASIPSAANYLWQDNSTLSTLMANASGTYDVDVIDTNGCTTSDTITLTVNPNPVVNIGNDTTVCGSITLDAGNAGATYLWCNAATTQSVTLSTSGTCEVMVTDANGCSSADTINVVVNPNPIVNLGADTASCGCITIDAGAGFVSYNWCDNSTSQTITMCASNTCGVIVMDTNGCSGSDTITVTVNQNPTVTVSAIPSMVCADDANVNLIGSPAGGTFSGPGVSGNSFDPSIGTGVQTVNYNYTDTNGCSGSATTQITVNACVGIAEQNNLSPVLVYPNPGSGIFNVQLNESAIVNVFDATGKLVAAFTLNGTGTHQIDGSSWSAGIYTMQVISGNAVNQVRLVVSE